MPFIDRPDAKMQADISRVAEKLLVASAGEQGSIVAMAALHLAIGLWQIGGATREQAETVCNKVIESSGMGRQN